MQVEVKLSHDEIRKAVANYINENTGVQIEPSAVRIQVKSKQNWKSEWEEADFRAEFTAARQP